MISFSVSQAITSLPLKKFALIIALVVTLPACATYYGAARISSVPAGAEVINLKDGTILGVTPTTVWWQSGSSDRQHVSLRIKLDGYYDKVAPFWLSMRHKTQADAMASPQVVDTALQRRGE